MAMTEMQTPTIINYARDEFLAEVKVLAQGDQSITFNTVPDGDFGIQVFIDKTTATTPSASGPAVNYDGMTVGTPSGGLVSVTIPFVSPITAAQAGTKAYLRVYK